LRHLWVLLGAALPGCVSEETEEAWRWKESHVWTRTREDSAEDLFLARCKPCHGDDGKHKTKMGDLQSMPDFTDPVWQAERSDREIRTIISDGSSRPGSRMVGFSGRLTPAEMDMLVPYIRQFNGR
jgi:mono/diheme cytochrome c family protein